MFEYQAEAEKLEG